MALAAPTPAPKVCLRGWPKYVAIKKIYVTSSRKFAQAKRVVWLSPAEEAIPAENRATETANPSNPMAAKPRWCCWSSRPGKKASAKKIYVTSSTTRILNELELLHDLRVRVSALSWPSFTTGQLVT
ncbi:hypothetical protein QBC46DRAFT_412660 [Diplogelasinospora grovesii]|uniref:Uncharacterized protein n=1 Tax=Diplogelasinospora grovesii TaxID=303347 RepID=A0AAN6MZ67_9PEZI|nr:hypothetical protein QBC46DRAFT_412660 [Diplogelasinospora grovesii]